MKIYNLFIVIVTAFFISACSDFLDREPDQLLTDDAVFSDPNMIQSAMANLYGRVNWGQSLTDNKSYIYLDEACWSDGGPDQTKEFANDLWRVYDYKLIRNMNRVLKSIRNSQLETDVKEGLEGEVRFLRAWTYFNMGRCLGGVPIVNDEVFEYESGMDITPLRTPRSTEEELYNYVVSECAASADKLSAEPTVNAAKANKWAALSLKARAAIYAASLAKYNNLMEQPVKTDQGEVGIEASKAESFYRIALEASEAIINGGKYRLQTTDSDKGINFYQAVTVKENNVEVIWALDYKYPGVTHQFTTSNIPISVKEDMDGTVLTPILNLVEAFEYKSDRNGSIKTTDSEGNYVFYEKAEDAFKDKDARLYGTIIYPGAKFRGKEIVYQAGRKYVEDGEWKEEVGKVGSSDPSGNLITSENGPVISNENNTNKTGFNIRKFLDETISSGTRGRGSEVWFVRFRYAEILLIASEAAMELNELSKAVKYINEVRERTGIQPLSTVTLDDIVQERRVELAFENHRYWDLKRWRLAHKIWDGDQNNPDAVQYVLFPYQVNQPGHPAHGKWVFDKKKAYMAPYPRYFQLRNYYNFLDQGWLNKNPKLVKNPFQ
ncbi:RagB/SusD family nutrient uptake outer membrane protein [Parabacteroides pacaensis]|uniref:RagB/SusD family nutrient uptake outer membrane protein n=1 Tax=Parabacteroides pacaensis TaxID=2086575 RepID=UPI000D113725|nr:RagB/SusD family nutrient uptake outer membrane protein [Parabacteroides pacaensis]